VLRVQISIRGSAGRGLISKLLTLSFRHSAAIFRSLESSVLSAPLQPVRSRCHSLSSRPSAIAVVLSDSLLKGENILLEPDALH
jgi:hypothetical protein